ncbi:MAG TPA: hypothetical protein VJZ27_17030, partial [Aggregatilineales bacterium]|nr:hypothetical protein [Aggregatilineales bacterium]
MSEREYEQPADELETLRKRVQELEQAEVQSRHIREAMERQDAILRVLAYAGEQIVLRHPYKVLPELLTRLGEAAAVSRVYLFENLIDEQEDL